jgi:hypothetical protein
MIENRQKTGLSDSFFTHVITNFGIMLMLMPIHLQLCKVRSGLSLLLRSSAYTALLVTECFRMLRPGGTCALSTWQSVGWILEIRAVIDSIAGAPKLPETEELMASMGKESGTVTGSSKATRSLYNEARVREHRHTSQRTFDIHRKCGLLYKHRSLG